ncbi:hypothetical protein AAMO2058_001121500 [Amorphochlora amoebiformis]
MKLLSIFYAEFDNIEGPKIVYQSPQGFLSAQDFEKISGYVIGGPLLSNKIITIDACGYRIMGYPVCIENSKYKRNALLFNLAFVFPTDVDLQAYNFTQTLTKLANTIQTLEHEASFLSNPETKKRLKLVLGDILESINKNGQSLIRIHPCCGLSLKIFTTQTNTPTVHPHEVPILIVDIECYVKSSWDLTLQQIIPLIDGTRYVSLIAECGGVDIKLVIECLRNLIYYQTIKMIDIFQFSNIYTTTNKINTLYKDCTLASECLRYISTSTKNRGGYGDGSASGKGTPEAEAPVLSRDKLVNLYFALNQGTTVGRFCAENKLDQLKLDVRRMIAFGVIFGFIRRLRRYPIIVTKQQCVKNKKNTHKNSSATNENSGNHQQLKKDKNPNLDANGSDKKSYTNSQAAEGKELASSREYSRQGIEAMNKTSQASKGGMIKSITKSAAKLATRVSTKSRSPSNVPRPPPKREGIVSSSTVPSSTVASSTEASSALPSSTVASSASPSSTVALPSSTVASSTLPSSIVPPSAVPKSEDVVSVTTKAGKVESKNFTSATTRIPIPSRNSSKTPRMRTRTPRPTRPAKSSTTGPLTIENASYAGGGHFVRATEVSVEDYQDKEDEKGKQNTVGEMIDSMCNGQYSFDEICVRLRVTHRAILARLNRHQETVVITR